MGIFSNFNHAPSSLPQRSWFSCVTASVPSASPSTQPTSEFEGLEAELAAKTLEVEALEDDLVLALANYNDQRQAMQGDLARNQTELAEKKEQIRTMEIGQLTMENRMQDEIDQLEAGFTNCKGELDDKINQIRDLEARVVSLESYLDARTSEVESLEAARANLTRGEIKSSYNANG